MCEDVIIDLAMEYTNNGSIKRNQFRSIFRILSPKQQDIVEEILIRNGICIVDDTVIDEWDFSTIKYIEENCVLNKDYDGVVLREIVFKINDYSYLLTQKKNNTNNYLCSLIQGEDSDLAKEALELFCIKNREYVYRIAKQAEEKNTCIFELDDYKQVGFLSLIEAARGHDAKYNYSRKHTNLLMWNKIKTESINTGYLIRVPVHMMEQIERSKKAIDYIEMNKSPAKSYPDWIQKIQDVYGQRKDKIEQCLYVDYTVLSLISLDDEKNDSYSDTIADVEAINAEERTERMELSSYLKMAFTYLTEREQYVLRMRFGLDDGRARTWEEVGRILNVTRERIRQIEAKGLRKLRGRFRWLREYLLQ